MNEIIHNIIRGILAMVIAYCGLILFKLWGDLIAESKVYAASLIAKTPYSYSIRFGGYIEVMAISIGILVAIK